MASLKLVILGFVAVMFLSNVPMPTESANVPSVDAVFDIYCDVSHKPEFLACIQTFGSKQFGLTLKKKSNTKVR